MADINKYLPDLSFEEINYLKAIIEPMEDEKAQMFSLAYRSKRKTPQNIMIMTLLGFFVVAGIQRFMLDQMGMGLLYLFTFGLCGIGTIIDLVNHKDMTLEYNRRIANELSMVYGSQI